MSSDRARYRQADAAEELAAGAVEHLRLEVVRLGNQQFLQRTFRLDGIAGGHHLLDFVKCFHFMFASIFVSVKIYIRMSP